MTKLQAHGGVQYHKYEETMTLINFMNKYHAYIQQHSNIQNNKTTKIERIQSSSRVNIQVTLLKAYRLIGLDIMERQRGVLR